VDKQNYSWERPIATQQVGFIFVSQSRSAIPDEIGGVYWYGMDNPYSNFFIPLYTTISELPKAYTVGSIESFSRDSAWWTFNFVANYANLRYSYMIKDIQKVQQEIEDMEFNLQPAIEQTAAGLLKSKAQLVPQFLTRYCLNNARLNLDKWWELAEYLITKYNDGYIQDEKGEAQDVGYPEQWLKEELKKNPDKFLVQGERQGEGEL
jgi:dipeptidase